MNIAKLLIATSNRGKALEIQQSLTDLPLELEHLSDISSIESVEESGTSYEQNAILKATFYAGVTETMALADDSGLEVEQLGGRPGIHTARYGGPSASNEVQIQTLLEELRAQPSTHRSAKFVCCIALCGILGGDTKLLKVARGECRGTIACEPRGKNGFGYDPIFIPAGFDATFAELPHETKREISHRARALHQIRAFLKDYLLKLDRPYAAT